MANINTSKLMVKDRAFWLSYDFGLEHGPLDMNLRNINPDYIFDLALEGKYTGIIVHAGLAQKYYHGAFREVPLIIKLNGKTSIPNTFPISKQICSVERALKLGADAVGYTIYDGSPSEPDMFHEFGKIVDQAHDYGLPAIAWMYPRGPAVHDELSTEILAYSARIALELGADFVKLKYNNNAEAFKWIVKCAGRTHVVVSEAQKYDDRYFLESVEAAMKTGAVGYAVSRNVWQHEKPFSMTRALHQIIFNKQPAAEAKKYLDQ